MEPAGSHHGYADSVGSSPRSRNTDSWEDPPLQSGAGAGAGKLRLMCSYGGHIVPRPHDKSLCYLGGDTRIVVVDRNLSLADLSAKLGRTLLDGRSFTLKYQLPNEDLDSLISVATDEDLDNMIEEYDRTSTSLKPSRLRLFLFPTKPDSASSLGSLLDDSKSETWFVDALNGAGIGPRGLSADSNSVNSLLGLDYAGPVTGTDTEPARSDKPTRQDVHSMPDSPMLGTTSSFGSASSVPSLSNLPPLRVRVDGRSGLEDQFSQMKTDDGFKDGGLVRDLPNPVVSGPAAVGAIGVMSPPAGFGENPSRVSLEEERPDLGFERKPSQKTGDLDSAAADARENLDTAIYHQQHIIYQDRIPHIPPQDHTSPGAVVSVPDPKREVANPNYGFPVQVQDPSLMMQMQPKQQQPQFIHTGPHYVQHHAPGSIPISSYYQMQPVQHSQQHQQVDQQYPMYYVSVRQNPLQKPAPVVNPAVGPPQYKDATPIYTPRSAPPPRPEMYRTAAVVPQQPHIHMQDPHHQYMGYHQAPSNYAYEYMDPTHGQIYYTQPTSTTLASQYQTVTSAAGVAEASMSPPAGPTDSKQN